MHRFVGLILASTIFTTPVWSSTFDFDIVARIDSAFLRPSSDRIKVPIGGNLRARMTYSFPPSQQFGGDYYFTSGLETLSIATDAGFALTLDNRVTSISSSTNRDTFIAQSFVSEDPNGWNMVFEVAAKDWLGGQTDLPALFPLTFESAYISAYFLDEFDIIQSVEATILSIQPAREQPVPVPVPASGAFLGILGLFAGIRLIILTSARKNDPGNCRFCIA